MEAFRRALILAGWDVDEKAYLIAVAVASASMAVLAAMAGGDITSATGAGIATAGILLYAPYFVLRIRAERAEADLPYVLRSIASEVDAGIDFITALKDAARVSKTIGRDIEQAIEMYQRGIPVERALKAVGETYTSETIRRAMLHIALLYHSGKETDALKKMADEMIAIQKAESKKFSSQLAMFTLVFVAIAALVPALFAMYVLIGSEILDMGLTPSDVWWLMLGAFPVASGLSLAYMYSRLPAYMRR